MERAEWLQDVMGEKWSNLGGDLQAWRQGVIEVLCTIDGESVVFTHFIAISVVVGKATSYDRVVCFWPDNCSVTIVDVNGSTLNLIARGDEAVLTKGSKPRIL